MSWTRSTAPEAATGAVAEAYAWIRERSSRKHVSPLWQAIAGDPAGLMAWYTLRTTLFDDPAPLTPVEAELIAFVVSATNGCGYCVAHHGPRMARLLGDEPLARAIARDYREADLPARHRVLLDYAVALSCEPSERTRMDVDRVREYGYDDLAVVKATEIAAFANGMTRIASALGVQLEPDVAPWEFGQQR
jgi:uncharacterized peroxidase-related enzyme